jgi:hypothetical protein
MQDLCQHEGEMTVVGRVSRPVRFDRPGDPSYIYVANTIATVGQSLKPMKLIRLEFRESPFARGFFPAGASSRLVIHEPQPRRNQSMVPAKTQRGAAGLFLLSLALLSGCRSGQPSHIDCYVGEVYYPFDASTDSLAPSDPFVNDAASSRRDPATHPVNWQDQPQPAREEEIASQRREPFQMPSELPRADTPPFHLPPHAPNTPEEQRQQAIPIPTQATKQIRSERRTRMAIMALTFNRHSLQPGSCVWRNRLHRSISTAPC